MTVEEQLQAMANAISIGDAPITADEVLARSSAEGADRAPGRRAWLIVGASAAVVVALLVAVVSLDGEGTDDVPVPAVSVPEATVGVVETTTPSTSASETTVPSTTQPPIPLDDDERALSVFGLDAQGKPQNTTIVANLPAPWETRGQLGRDFGTLEWVTLSFWAPQEVMADSCRWTTTGEGPGRSVDEVAAALVANVSSDATTPVPVTVGGYEGLYLELSLPSDLDLATCDRGGTVPWGGYRGSHTGGANPVPAGSDAKFAKNVDLSGQIDRVWILDVEGRTLLIDASFLPPEQETIRGRVDEVIDSIRFVTEG